MSTELVLDPASTTPPYEQIREQLRDLIQVGRLEPGVRLPPVRQLAADLGIAPGTVARAYKELEEEHLLITRRGAGTTVAETQIDRAAVLRARAESYVAHGRSLGFSDAELRAGLNEAF